MSDAHPVTNHGEVEATVLSDGPLDFMTEQTIGHLGDERADGCFLRLVGEAVEATWFRLEIDV